VDRLSSECKAQNVGVRSTKYCTQAASSVEPRVLENYYRNSVVHCPTKHSSRGHEEDRSNLGEVSDINRGNFLELLHLRSKDIPWLGEKLTSQLHAHMQWTSPIVQNEILDIMAEVVLGSIANDVKMCSGYSIIVDETSDVSRVEQVAICLRFITEGETRESFIGFYATPSTKGSVFYELVKNVLGEAGAET